ncbi:MAG TPA: LLM class flavin-dependent oxidoreductase [Ktedonobacteraceae bacterium]|nr:LLM class flavin-dependent oxidoreductase [Ktedonobacteraceae bacterium]
MQDTREVTARPTHPWVAEKSPRVRVGVKFIDPCADWTRYHACAQVAEDLGYDSLWVPDHPMVAMDCWSILTALAITTRRIRLGTLATCVYYRSPVMLARKAVDVDRLSGGRLILGIGIGDQPHEFEQLGLAFPGVSERQEMLEKVITSVQKVWEQLPLGPVQQPHIPVLIAGGGERTLRQVAQYADASNFGPHNDTGGVSQLEDVEHKGQVLRTHCATIGRDPQSILQTHVTLPLVLGTSAEAIAAKQEAIPLPLRSKFTAGTLAVTPQEALEYYRNLAKMGIHYFILGLWPGDVETMRLFSEHVMPFLSE